MKNKPEKFVVRKKTVRENLTYFQWLPVQLHQKHVKLCVRYNDGCLLVLTYRGGLTFFFYRK